MALRSVKDSRKLLWPWCAHRRNGIALALAVFFAVIRGVQYWLSRYSELFQGAHEIGQVVAWMAEAYLGSWIFYLVVVRIREKADEINTRPYIKRKVRDLIDIHFEITNILCDRIGEQTSSMYPTETEIQDWFTRLAGLEERKREGLRSFFVESIQRIVLWHNLLYKMTHHIDSDLIPILIEIEDGRFAHGDVFNCDAFRHYQNGILKLRDYYEERFKEPFQPVFANAL